VLVIATFHYQEDPTLSADMMRNVDVDRGSVVGVPVHVGG